MTRPAFARELPCFIAEVRDIYFDHLERMAAIEDEHAANEDDDDPSDRRAVEQVRLAQLRVLLALPVLGTA